MRKDLLERYELAVREAEANGGRLFRPDELVVRAIDVKARTADFVAATEIGVPRYGGTEWLQMSGVQLERYRKNPVALDSHMYESDRIIGRAPNTRVNLEQRSLDSTFEFANTARAEELWKLVRDGFLRTVSVGYFPREWRFLDDNETYDMGAARTVKGPGVVIQKWELLEISLVPIPADENALLRQDALVRRTIFDFGAARAARRTAMPPGSIYSTALLGAAAAPDGAGSATSAPASNVPAVAARAADQGGAIAVPASPAPAAQASAAPPAPATPAPAANPAAPTQLAAAATANPPPATQPGTTAPGPGQVGVATTPPGELEGSAKARAIVAFKQELTAIAPPALRAYAEELGHDLALRGVVDVEVGRKRLLEEHAKRNKPVGTPEPPAPAKTTPDGRLVSSSPAKRAEKLADVPVSDFAGAFKRGP